MNDNFEEVTLRTGVDPLFFAETLTTDVELRDALYDLIDNAIDAARNQIVSNDNYKRDKFGLPSNYSEFKVFITFSKNEIVISDNCFGIDSETVEGRVFYTGEKSNHKYGIGHYGIGLKRALLKVGKLFHFETDDGCHFYEADFSSDILSGDKQNRLTAKKRLSRGGRPGTSFKVSELKIDTVNQVSSREWWNETIELLSLRYSIFVRKGFEIIIKNKCLEPEDEKKIVAALPEIRSPRFFDAKNEIGGQELQENFKGVSVFYRVGLHSKYRFLGESGSDKNKTPRENGRYTKEFGIYFVCNDRVIVGPTFEDKYGFTETYHSEYGGFLCYVFLVSENPANLPWNTAKTELKVHSPLFIATKKEIKPLVKGYISTARSIIKYWTDPKIKDLPFESRQMHFQNYFEGDTQGSVVSSPKERPKRQNELTLNSQPEKNTQSLIKSEKNNQKAADKHIKTHTQSWKELLPGQFPVSATDQVLNNMIIEASQLKIAMAPHASAMLYRALFEGACVYYVKKKQKYKFVKDHYYSQGEGKKKNHTDVQKKEQGVSSPMVLDWLRVNGDEFHEHDRKKLLLATKKMLQHVKKLNGVVHCLEMLSDNEIITIRNESIGLLEFLVTLGQSHEAE
jgi:hypothetical protein